MLGLFHCPLNDLILVRLLEMMNGNFGKAILLLQAVRRRFSTACGRTQGKRFHFRRERGLSAVELLIVLGGIFALTALALPATRQARGLFELTTAADEITSNLEYARSEAVKRDGTATVTFNSGGTYTVQYTNAGSPVTLTRQLPSSVSFALPTGVSAVSVQFFSSGRVVVTPAGTSLVLRGAYGQRTLSVSVAGNIQRS